MKREDIEKFVHENVELARSIANYECGNNFCDKCVFDVCDVPPFNCLSLTISSILADTTNMKIL